MNIALRNENGSANDIDRAPSLHNIGTVLNHSSQKPTYNSDDVTVVTDNTSQNFSFATPTGTVPQFAAEATNVIDSISHILPPSHEPPPIETRNCFDVLDAPDNEPAIAVNSGASDNFGRRSAPGTDRQYTTDGISMISATKDVKTSVATDKFNLQLTEESLECHVHKDTDIQRPLFSVEKAFDARCKVFFDEERCLFYKGGKMTLEGLRDKHTKLHLLPHGTNKRTPINLDEAPPHQALDAFQDQTVPQLM